MNITFQLKGLGICVTEERNLRSMVSNEKPLI